MKPQPNLRAPEAPPGVEVYQLTHGHTPACHVYMEAQIFTPDSKRLILHESAHAHGSDPRDPEHRYLLCDLENNGALSPVTSECGATAPSVSPDGTWMYYFVDQTQPGGGRLTLKRVRLDGSDRETLHVLDTPPPRCSFHLVHPYPLSTLSSDGRRLAISARLANGEPETPVGILLVYDLDRGTVDMALCGTTWCNIHPQYSRSLDDRACRDILVQQNHGYESSPDGGLRRRKGTRGADIHVIRDDGTDFRTFPWGRDGIETCQGHQCWRGRSQWAITSTIVQSKDVAELIESPAIADARHIGAETPGGQRNNLSANFEQPSFWHFATDIAGTRLVTDYKTPNGRLEIVLADLPTDSESPLTNYRTLVVAGAAAPARENHAHPFLSPDGETAFFNSTASGTLQAYMVRWAKP